MLRVRMCRSEIAIPDLDEIRDQMKETFVDEYDSDITVCQWCSVVPVVSVLLHALCAPFNLAPTVPFIMHYFVTMELARQ